MKIKFFFCIVMLSGFVANAQEQTISVNDEPDTIYRSIEHMPEFPGGIKKLQEFILENTEYPEEAKQNNIQGQAIVQILVSKSGRITDIKILRSVGYGCDEAAIRLIQKMPDWKPGKHFGKNVNTYYLLPITFAPMAVKKNN